MKFLLKNLPSTMQLSAQLTEKKIEKQCESMRKSCYKTSDFRAIQGGESANEGG